LCDPKRRMRASTPLCIERASSGECSPSPRDIGCAFPRTQLSAERDLAVSGDARPENESTEHECDEGSGNSVRAQQARGDLMCVDRGLSWSSLPDDIVTHMLRYITNASELLALCGVCSHWNHLIRSTPELWKCARFHGLRFSRRVEFAHPNRPQLLPDSKKDELSPDSRFLDLNALTSVTRPVAHRCSSVPFACMSKQCYRRMVLESPRGEHTLRYAARVGNLFAALLLSVAFEGHGIPAVTVYSDDAARILSAAKDATAAEYPSPALRRRTRGARANVQLPCEAPYPMSTWVAIHAARCDLSRSPRPLRTQDDATIMDMRNLHADLRQQPSVPRGAIIGLVHVTECRRLDTNTAVSSRALLPTANALALAGPAASSPQTSRPRAAFAMSAGALHSRRNSTLLHADMPRPTFEANADRSASWDRRYLWTIDEALCLESPITCAGYHGVWKLGPEMSEVVVRAPMTDHFEPVAGAVPPSAAHSTRAPASVAAAQRTAARSSLLIL